MNGKHCVHLDANGHECGRKVMVCRVNGKWIAGSELCREHMRSAADAMYAATLEENERGWAWGDPARAPKLAHKAKLREAKVSQPRATARPEPLGRWLYNQALRKVA